MKGMIGIPEKEKKGNTMPLSKNLSSLVFAVQVRDGHDGSAHVPGQQEPGTSLCWTVHTTASTVLQRPGWHIAKCTMAAYERRSFY
jgi:hypothetical protein